MERSISPSVSNSFIHRDVGNHTFTPEYDFCFYRKILITSPGTQEYNDRAELRSWHAARSAGSSARGFKMPLIHGEAKSLGLNAKKYRRGWKH